METPGLQSEADLHKRVVVADAPRLVLVNDVGRSERGRHPQVHREVLVVFIACDVR